MPCYGGQWVQRETAGVCSKHRWGPLSQTVVAFSDGKSSGLRYAKVPQFGHNAWLRFGRLQHGLATSATDE